MLFWILEKEMKSGRFLLVLLLFISLQYEVIAFSIPSRGCYWTESCQSKWVGGCGAGHVIIGQSNDCDGLCPEPKYSPCLPFSTHFHCCKPEKPKLTDRCTKCRNKIDYGDAYVCCTDCSDPYVVERHTKSGYCQTGAEMALQLKAKEVFRWVAGSWMTCSSPCDGGVRYRDVGCFGSIEDTSIPHYPVDDSRCSAEGMPLRQESCNLISCFEISNANANANEGEQRGMSGLFLALLILLGLVSVGSIGVVGYRFYKRKTGQNGFVYVTLDGYS